MNRYISNVPGGKGSNMNAGTSEECPWYDFTPLHQYKMLPGDKILLERGSCWDQQLTLIDSGDKAHLGCAVDAYGSGPLPKIIRNGDPLERCIYMYNPSYWRIANVEVGCAGVGILVYYDTPDHEGLRFDNILVHDCYGIFTRDMPDSPARAQAVADRIFLSAGILITAAPLTLAPEQCICKNIRFDNIEGMHNGDSIALDQYDGDINGGYETLAEADAQARGEYAFQDVILNHLYLHDDDGPNPGGIPDSLRLFRTSGLTLLNSWIDACCGRFTSSGTAEVILVGVNDARFVNNAFTRTPDTGSVDQCAIDFEAYNSQVKLQNNYFGGNAGPGVEFLDIHGAKAWSKDNEIMGCAFESNGWSTHGGQAGSGGIHHYGDDIATGVIRDNLVHEPGKPLYHGKFVHFTLANNLLASQPMYNAPDGFAGVQGQKGWRYQVRMQEDKWTDLPYYDSAKKIWRMSADDALAWVSAFEQFAAQADWAVARAWQAPAAGKVAIRSRLLKTYAGGSKVPTQITLNGRAIWGPQACSAKEREGSEANLDNLAVQAGDMLRFEVGGPAGWIIDAVSWAPTIAYIG
ncbi:MAG: hypothetical protein LLG44_13550 [Chloroflexi bacterium]|nr:hypothetical protein [Chloroflexota bacterium]